MENKNVFDETVTTLINDAKSLQKKFTKLQEDNNFRGAIDCMRLLKDTLSLIKEYDWEPNYSEYETDGHKEIAVWEQNHCGEIKNHKKWIISTLVTENKWKDIFKLFIQNNQSILYELSYVDSDEERLHRGTGKSYAIETLAIENDLPIFTSKYRASQFNKLFEDKIKRAFSSYDDFRSSSESKIILVDEGFIDEDIFNDLIENHDYILIGFRRKFK